MVYSSKQQPTTPLLVVGHEISYSSSSSNGDNSNTNSNSHRRGGNGNAVVNSGGRGVAAMDSGAGSGSAGGGHSAALGYWNRSPVALNKSSNRYIDQSKAFIVEDAFSDSLKRGGGGGSPYYHPPPPPLQAMNPHHHRHHAGAYYGSNAHQQQHSDSRNNSMTRPTNRSNTSATAMNESLSEVSRFLCTYNIEYTHTLSTGSRLQERWPARRRSLLTIVGLLGQTVGDSIPRR